MEELLKQRNLMIKNCFLYWITVCGFALLLERNVGGFCFFFTSLILQQKTF